MDLLKDSLPKLFWTESLWLPKGYSWKDIATTANIQKGDVYDLCVVPVLAVCISVVRYVFERNVACRFCTYIGIKHTTCYPDSPSDTYNQYKSRKRYTLRKKSTETCWRAASYLYLLAYGICALFTKDWFWNSTQWFTGYIGHELTNDMKWYFLFEISFYVTLFVSQFTDTKRKDFYQLFVHHIVTLYLLIASYLASLYRIGCIIMIIHDASDFWLETAKIANYAKKEKLCNVLFGMFALVFFCTRLIYYPLYVGSAYFTYYTYNVCVVMRLCVTLSFLILFLNCYWGILILKMIYRLVVKQEKNKDARSESSGEV